MTREEIIDGLELYTVGRPKKERVHITVEELQKFIEELKKQNELFKIGLLKDCESCSKAIEQTGWIPVSERLPEESGYYLANVYIEDCYFSEVCVRLFAHPDDYFITAGEWRECADDELVTAWMPLPEPYKAESEGEE